jgi:hypothetical protein
MRRIIALLTGAALLVMALAVPAFAEKDPVTVCHNPNDPHLINVSEKAVAAHQEHQDDTSAQCDDNGDGLD